VRLGPVESESASSDSLILHAVFFWSNDSILRRAFRVLLHSTVEPALVSLAGWPRLLISSPSPIGWGTPSFAFTAKGGLFDMADKIVQAASPPTLAKNARMGHPQWKRCRHPSLSVGTRPLGMTDKIVQAASPPTLAKNARMGHPQWKRRQAPITERGHPPARHGRQDSAGCIAAHPCKERKDGAPSVEAVQAHITERGHPPSATAAVRKSCQDPKVDDFFVSCSFGVKYKFAPDGAITPSGLIF
jgi:hypothetical protein